MTRKNPKIDQSLHILGRLKACAVCTSVFPEGYSFNKHFHCSKTIRLRDVTRYLRIKSLIRVLSALMCSYARASLVPRRGESVQHAVSNKTRICISHHVSHKLYSIAHTLDKYSALVLPVSCPDPTLTRR